MNPAQIEEVEEFLKHFQFLIEIRDKKLEQLINTTGNNDLCALLRMLSLITVPFVTDHLDVIKGVHDLPEFDYHSGWSCDRDLILKQKKDTFHQLIPEIISDVLTLIEVKMLGPRQMTVSLRQHIVEKASAILLNYYAKGCYAKCCVVDGDVQQTQFRMLASVLLNVCGAF